MNDKPTYSPAGEINLFLLAGSVWRFFRRAWLYLLVGFFVGVAAGVIYYNTTPRKYEATMHATATYLTDVQMEMLLYELDLMWTYGATDDLREALRLPRETIEAIDGIDVQVKERNLFNDEDYYHFTLTLTTRDQSVYPAVQQALLDYLNRTPYAELRVRSRRDQLARMIADAERELTYLRDLQTTYGEVLADRASAGSLMLPDFTETSQKIADLGEKLGDYHDEYDMLAAEGDVALVKGFVKAQKQKSPRRSTSLLFWTSLSMFLALLLFVAINWRRLVLPPRT